VENYGVVTQYRASSSVFRRVLGWSLILALAMCVIVWLQSTSLFDWMVVGE
jgi:hypothetical protein